MNLQEQQKYLQQIDDIKNLMERNTKFLSLSGLSGVWAGATALVGAFIASKLLSDNFLLYKTWQQLHDIHTDTQPFLTLAYTATCILVIAVLGGFYFTHLKAKKIGQTVVTAVSKVMLLELFFVLTVGGIFCLILLYHGAFAFIAPSTLLFYGMALFCISRYTVRDIKVLAILEILLGLLNAVFIYNGILFWCIGFGLLHIIYGIIMYYKYDRN